MHASTNLYPLKQPPLKTALGDCAKPAGVLAIHGSASNGKLWRPLQAALHGHREVIAPDLDGYGPHSVPSLRASQRDRLEHLSMILHAQPEPMDLVAHSFGGAIALRLADAFPDRVRRVSIYDPVVPVRRSAGGAELPCDLQALLRLVDNANAEAVMQSFFEYWGSADAWHALREDKRQRLLGYHAAFLRDVSELQSGKWTVLRSRFKGPITVFRGTASKTATQQSCAHVAATFAQTRWIELSGLDHLAPITNPEPVTKALLNDLGASSAASERQLTGRSRSAA